MRIGGGSLSKWGSRDDAVLSSVCQMRWSYSRVQRAREVRGLVKRRSNKTLWAGCACGLLCALCVGAYLLSVDGEKRAAEAEMLSRYGGDQVQACVAKHDIAAGETVTEGDVE